MCSSLLRVLYETSSDLRCWTVCEHDGGCLRTGILEESLQQYGSLIPVHVDDVVEKLQNIFSESFSQPQRSVRSFFFFFFFLSLGRLYGCRSDSSSGSGSDICVYSVHVWFRKAVVQHLIQSFQRSSGSALAKTFRVNYKRHVLTMDDLGTLYGQNWLNDQVRSACSLTSDQKTSV